MPRFAGTHRTLYTKDKVRQLRIDRLKKKPVIEGIPDSSFQKRLGDLLAAGHLKIDGFKIMNVNEMEAEYNKETIQRDYTIQFEQYQVKELGEKPHFTGYLQSANQSDPNYRLKGWFNTDGTIRLELVK